MVLVDLRTVDRVRLWLGLANATRSTASLVRWRCGAVGIAVSAGLAGVWLAGELINVDELGEERL